MKYEPLKRHLQGHAKTVVPLSFEEIERIIGSGLPPSARRHPAWWSNNPNNHVNAQSWLSAGYKAEAVDLARGQVRFRRAKSDRERPDPAPRLGGHPIFGCMKGTVKIAPGVDLTEPAAPDWGRVYE